MELLQQLCAIHAPAGNEGALKDFLIAYIQQHSASWKVQPELIYGEQFQDCLLLKFGNPRTAIYAHMDSIGFTVRYNNQLVKIGGPVIEEGTILVGADKHGLIETLLQVNEEERSYFVSYYRTIERGTELVYKPIWRETEQFVQCCYMDNRLGVWNALKVAETLENGLIVFSCWEEHGGGTVEFLAKFMYEEYGIKQALISDITWVTEGVEHGKGVAISMRDQGIPRRKFINKIVGLAEESGIPFQLEVEGAGGSDGGYLQRTPYPIDWCFIGAPEDFVHSANEKVHKKDIEAMVAMYAYLMEKL